MKTWLRLVLVALSVGGGFTGAAMTLPLLLHPVVHSFSHMLMTACFFLLFGFVTVSGLMFVANWEKTRLLFVALALQIPYISSPLLTYKFGTGLPVFVIVGFPEAGRVGLYFGGDAALGSTWRFGYGEDVPLQIGVNVAAAVMLFLLWQAVQAAKPSLAKLYSQQNAS